MSAAAEPARAEAPPAPARVPWNSSFGLALRLLPPDQRQAMYEVYAFCRAVDDVADEPGPRPERLAALDGWRADVEALARGAPPPRLAGLAGPTRAYGLRREDFLAVIDGVATDATGDLVAPDWATLDLYCDRVASAVGRLSVRVFGLPEREGLDLAHHLGRALQLTNILRDLDEDAGRGRLYLPGEALREAGILDVSPTKVLAHPALSAACAVVAARAEGHFAEARRIMAGQPPRAVRAPRLMAAAYAPVLARMSARGWAAPRTRESVGKARLLWDVLRGRA